MASKEKREILLRAFEPSNDNNTSTDNAPYQYWEERNAGMGIPHLIKMSVEKCYTLTRDNPAIMWVSEDGIDVVYPSGNIMFLPRTMVVKAINMLINQGALTVDEVHFEITNEYRTRTDKLMAVLRKLPGVTIGRFPRVLYYNTP